MRPDLPTVFCALKSGKGVDALLEHLAQVGGLDLAPMATATAY